MSVDAQIKELNIRQNQILTIFFFFKSLIYGPNKHTSCFLFRLVKLTATGINFHVNFCFNVKNAKGRF